jgi:hypothetical protein
MGRSKVCTDLVPEQCASYADQVSSAGSTPESPISASLGGLAIVLDRYGEADTHFTRLPRSATESE